MAGAVERAAQHHLDRFASDRPRARGIGLDHGIDGTGERVARDDPWQPLLHDPDALGRPEPDHGVGARRVEALHGVRQRVHATGHVHSDVVEPPDATWTQLLGDAFDHARGAAATAGQQHPAPTEAHDLGTDLRHRARPEVHDRAAHHG